MANDEHVAILKQGVDAWNAWREKKPDVRPDLSGAKLSKANLSAANLCTAYLNGANLHRANLRKADLSEANLTEANLRKADLREANLTGATLNWANLTAADFGGAFLTNTDITDTDLSGANLSGATIIEARLWDSKFKRADLSGACLTNANLAGADLRNADLSGAFFGWATLTDANFRRANLSGASLAGANLSGAKLREANLSGSNFQSAILVNADLRDADLTRCRIHGVSAWDLRLEGVKQQDLIITKENEPEITVDSIEVAQFVYLMLNNQKVRDVIDSITSKAVLILGRFTDERKAVLDALREELRKRNYLPILFDFSVPATRDITETISLLARMARFVVADITDAKSIPQELSIIVPDLPSVPVQPLLLEGNAEYGMFEHFKRYPWVLETYRYPSSEHLIANLGERVIGPAENYAQSLKGATPQGAGPTGSS